MASSLQFASWILILVLIISINNNNATENVNNSSLHYEYVLLEDKHPCTRTCVQGEAPMVCHYHFTVENYYTMTKACHDCPQNLTDCYRNDCIPGDGHSRAIVVINRQMPGPAIEVCQNDLIVVDVENHLMSESTTIHWHGQHQLGSPYMDGVPFVTQCPILPKTTFRYSFKAQQAGTHLWHSHIGMQRVDGCFGPIIVRIPAETNPVKQFYDYDLEEHVMTLIDWEQVTATEKFLYHHHSIGDNKPSTLLVNGFGRHKLFGEAAENETYYTPLARFTVKQGFRYRFRIINAGYLNCPIEVSVDNHTLNVISTDGFNVAPVEAESLVTYAGERFDFGINADQEKKLYWIRFRGLMDCDERFTKAHQVAVLEYEGYDDRGNDSTTANSELNYVEFFNGERLPGGNPDYDNSARSGKQINSLNKGTESNNTKHVSMPELSSLDSWDSRLKVDPDVQIYLAYDFYTIDNKYFHREGYEFNNVTSSLNQLLTPQINHISMEIPSFSLLSQREEIPKNMFCNNDTIKDQDCANSHCECPHGYQIPLNAVVELVIIDEGFAYDANHPLHLHGYAFRVVAMERLGRNVTVDEVKKRDSDGYIKRNLINAPIKDTVNVPDGGYTIVRFKADNPGYWIFHCHIEFHAEVGMALVFQVGENGQMPPVPKGFPTCGNYLPEEEESTGNGTTSKPSDLKPVCSKNLFVNKFEKVLFGDYCRDEMSAARHLLVPSVLIAVFAIIVTFITN
ncbi:laccase-2-like [Sitophilus oryzae]|uniref:Laccase-2-like n=1 Tax=Sitophilus oryzae TaxID=7048 RepID=A0A6J2XXS1_SITOR|nr:laccase-2-like [Sitophilus oryzae]